MGEPWGLSGPQFTGLYAAGYVVAVVLVFVVQGVLARAGSRDANPPVHLDTYQAAYLAGGPGRVADTAVAALALRGSLHIARNGLLTMAGGATAHGPVETAALAACVPSGRISRVRLRLRQEPSVTVLGEELRAWGLLLHGRRAVLWRLVLLLPVAVWVTGAVRAVNGANLNRPIGNLLILLVISGIATFVLLSRRRLRRRPSPLGRAVLAELRARHASVPAPRRRTVEDSAMAMTGVAVLGLAAVDDPALRSALLGSIGSTSSGGGGDSGGSGSSCGGGGCGGGGCGG